MKSLSTAVGCFEWPLPACYRDERSINADDRWGIISSGLVSSLHY